MTRTEQIESLRIEARQMLATVDELIERIDSEVARLEAQKRSFRPQAGLA